MNREELVQMATEAMLIAKEAAKGAEMANSEVMGAVAAALIHACFVERGRDVTNILLGKPPSR